MGSSRMMTSGVVDDGLRDADALLIAFGQGADDLVARILQRAAALGPGQRGLQRVARHAAQFGGEPEVAVHRHLAVQRRRLRQKADARPRQHRLAHEVVAADLYLSAMRGECPGQHLQGGALACAVVPQQAQHLAASELQRYVVDDLALAVAADEVACGKGGLCCVGHACYSSLAGAGCDVGSI